MRVIDPRAISLKSTNVAANSQAEWAAGTTYGLGDEIQVTTATPHTVYKSLRGNNTGRNPADSLTPVQEVGTSTTSIAIGDGAHVFTIQPGLSFSAGMIVEITKTTTPKTVNMTAEVTAYNSGTGELSVMVYSTSGEGSHADWTITSEDEIGFWEDVGSTNQYKMFDEYINTQTENLEEIDFKLDTERADYVALFGLEGKLVELELWDSTENTLLWSGEIDLIYGSPTVAQISDWYEYFFGEFSAQKDATSDIGVITYAGVLRIKITAETGLTAKCGNVIVGRAFDIGTTQYDAKAGMVDFSDIATDKKTGRMKVVQGPWAKRNSVKLRIENYKLDAIYKLLTTLRGVPTAWDANNSGIKYESFVVFGLFKDFDIIYSNDRRSWCELEIKGII